MNERSVQTIRSGEKTQEKQKRVPHMVGRLTKNCETLHQRLAELEAALVSVLRRYPDEPTSEVETGRDEPTNDLAGSLDEISSRITRSFTKLEEITERLEI